MKVGLLTCNESKSAIGGGNTFATNLCNCLVEELGHDAKILKFKDTELESCDVLLLCSFGMSGENANHKRAEERINRIKNLSGKIPSVFRRKQRPVIMVRHGLTEVPIFKFSYSLFKDFEFDAIISVENSTDMFEHISETFRAKKIFHVPHPFKFNLSNLKDKSEYADVFASSSRIESCKNTNLFIMASSVFRDKKFQVWGEERGMYWYYAVKNDPLKQFCTFMGKYTDYTKVYDKAAFGVDLTYIHKGKRANKQRTQYTVIEAVDCGAIPVGFDVWKWDEGYDGVWLPSPIKKGNRLIFDYPGIEKAFAEAKYDSLVATYNWATLEKLCGYKNVGKHLKEVFDFVL